MRSARSISLAVSLIVLAWSGATHAQSYTAPKFNYSYGYQPYNDRNPTGFNHPSDMGYGRYVYSPKFKGNRAGALSYRRFKGY